MERPNAELNRLVHVTAQLTAKWDGKDYDLSKGATLKYGIVHHWEGMHPNTSFTVEEVKEDPTPDKPVGNPLEAMDRGNAFAGLKRGRPRKEDE